MFPPDVIASLAFWIFKSLWESRDEAYKLLSQRVKQVIFYASKEYEANYISRHGFIKQEDFRPSTPSTKAYISPSFIEHYRLTYSSTKKSLDYKEIDYMKSLQLTHSGLELVNKYQHLVVKGESGIGKTTFLKKVGLEAFKSSQNCSLSNSFIPVFIQLPQVLENEFNIKNMIEREFEVCGFPEYQDFVDSALRKGKLLILIDEFDSVPFKAQESVLLKLKNFSDKYGNNKMIFACRRSKKTRVLRKFHEVSILGLGSKQIQEYISQIHKTQNQESLPKTKHQEIWRHIGEINLYTKRVVHNPSCLSIILSLYQSSDKKILGITVLYEKILSRILNRNKNGISLSSYSNQLDLGIDLKRKIISEIAYVCLKSGRSIFHRAEIYRLLSAVLKKYNSNNASIDFESFKEDELFDFLTQLDGNLFRFNNILVQKFLVAHHLMDSLKVLDSAIESFVDRSDWKEVFVFLSGMQGSDYLILVIYTRVCEKLDRCHLVEFMEWVNSISERVNISASEATNRCHIVFTIFEIMLLFGDFNHNRFTIGSILNQIKETIFLLEPERNIISPLKLDKNSYSEFNTNHFIDPKILKGLSLDRILDLALIFAEKSINCNLITASKSRKLITTLSHLKSALRGKSLPYYQRKICESNLYKLWIDTFDIPEKFLEFSADDLQSLYLYCRGTNLIISCLSEAFYISGKVYEDINNSLFCVSEPSIKQLEANRRNK